MSHETLFPDAFWDCVACLESVGVTSSSEALVAIARLVDRYLRVESSLPLGMPPTRNWISTAIHCHLSELIDDWRGEDLPELLRRAHGVVPIDWGELHAELLSYRDGPKAYEWASGKLRSKSYLLSQGELEDLTAGFLNSGTLARAVSGFDLGKGGGKEASWLTTVFYRYALHELRRPQPVALDDLPDPPAHGPSPEENLRIKEELCLLKNRLCELPPDDRELVRLRGGFGTRKHALQELVPRFGRSPYIVGRRLVTIRKALGLRRGSGREPVPRHR